MPLSINHYLNNLPLLADQWNAYNYKESNRQRIYLKDIDCPLLWHEKLKEQIPAGVFYLNDSTGEVGGPGSVEERNPHGLGLRKTRGISRAGDLMSCLPPTMRAENLMCYIGHEGTYTPAHREMCASLGQNIMVETSGTIGEDGQPTKPGSSIWFMTETKDRHLVSEYWLSVLGHDIEIESHFAQINAWKAAPFTTYVVEQKVGDFLLIPPLAPHQVWNRGTRTMKVAWNRTTVETLEMALNEALPRARMVCRDEQYKNKAIVLFSLQRYSSMLRQVELQKKNISDQQQIMDLMYNPKIRQLQKDFKRLYSLFTQILLSEMPAPTSPPEKRMQYLPYDSNVTCSYCRCNIFNRFLTCPTCVTPLPDGGEDTYDICLECYAIGRSCRCLSKFKWVEQFPWKDLVEKHDLWRSQILNFENKNGDVLHSLDFEKKHLKKKTLAEICQEQLKLRPWHDPKQQDKDNVVEEEPPELDEVNNDGSIKKKAKKKRSEKWLQDNVPCHICVHRGPRWKHAFCGCGLAFCYGTLWRGFDMFPQSVMENPDWKCPRCLKICSCSLCCKNPKNKPFEPKGTILGHDTKKFADPRSIESLVDFSTSNMHWVKKAGDDHPHDTRRLRRHQDQAEQAKSQDVTLDENYVDDVHDIEPTIANTMTSGNDAGPVRIPIDPLLNMTMDPDLFRSAPKNYVANSNKNETMVAPVANMTSRAREDASYLGASTNLRDSPYHYFEAPDTGITYEYPDPDESVSVLEPTNYPDPQPFQSTPTHPEPSSRPEEPCAVGQKRKKAGDRPMVRSDLVIKQHKATKPLPPESRNSKRMASALPIGQFVNGNDTTKPQQYIVKLRINSTKLASLGFETNMLDHERPERSTIIISSDVPSNPGAHGTSSQNTDLRKRRLHKDELDEDFNTRKKKNKKTNVFVSNVRRTSNIQYVEASDSEIEEETSFAATNTSKSVGRSLPGYLARRSPVDTSNLPKELSEKRSYRVSPKELNQRHGGSADVDNWNSVQLTATSSILPSLEETPANMKAVASDALVKVNEIIVTGGLATNLDNSTVTASAVTKEAPVQEESVDQHQIIEAAAHATESAYNSARVDAMEANRQAKLKAAQWAQSIFDDVESDSDSGQSYIELTPPKRFSSGNSPVAPKPVTTKPSLDTMKTSSPIERQSIFSRTGVGKKIRITSAKSTMNGVGGINKRNQKVTL